MVDKFDDGSNPNGDDPLNPLNLKKKSKRTLAIALQKLLNTGDKNGGAPVITAAGQGKIAEQILQLAFENGIKVREDKVLADILAAIELDSPIPSEAFTAVAEIFSYVYKADGQSDPFDTIFEDDKDDN